MQFVTGRIFVAGRIIFLWRQMRTLNNKKIQTLTCRTGEKFARQFLLEILKQKTQGSATLVETLALWVSWVSQKCLGMLPFWSRRFILTCPMSVASLSFADLLRLVSAKRCFFFMMKHKLHESRHCTRIAMKGLFSWQHTREFCRHEGWSFFLAACTLVDRRKSTFNRAMVWFDWFEAGWKHSLSWF